MPLYDFKCLNCSEVTEFLVPLELVEKESAKLDLPEKFACPKCGKTAYVRLPAAHGKSPINWSEWNSLPPKPPVKRKPKKR